VVEVDSGVLRDICDRYGIARLDVFGSVSRGDAAAGSDIDVLYELRPGARLGWEIEDLADSCQAPSAGGWTSSRGTLSTTGCGTRSWRRPACCMRRELLLIGEMIEAAEQARSLVAGIAAD
jgi:hypothetical protein